MMRLLMLALLLLPGLAVAQPRLFPTVDVTATYRLTGALVDQIPGGAPDGVRLQWDAAGQRLRADPARRPTYAIVDLTRRVAQLVFAQQSGVLELPLRGGDPQTLLTGADVQFTRRGPGRVLGQDCTEWRVQSRKLSGVGCVTADGVILQANVTYDGRPGAATATSVERGAIPPERFSVPPEYFRLPLAGAR